MTDAATTSSVEEIERRIGKFLEAKTQAVWEPETDLFASGVVSSLFAMELVVFVEGTFDIEVEGADLAIDNFRSVRAMSSLVTRLRGAGADA
jgi:methoxymalonate biosynthesis acyl carrier protein